MTKPKVARSMRQSTSNLRVSPPSKPTTLAVAVSLAMGASPAFGAWGNEVDVWVRPGTDRSYGGIEGVLPLSQSGTSLTFADLKFKLGQSGTYEGNLGVGHRFLTSGGDWALGFYGAWDHRRSKNSNSFNQITGGAEARSDKLDFRFNYYWPITDRERLGAGNNYGFEGFNIIQSGIWEEAMKGYDVEAGVLLPISSKWETRAYAAYYNFEGKDIAPQTDGWRVRVEVRPMHNLAIGLSHQQDDMFDNQTSLELRYIFGKDSKSGVRGIKDRMTDPWTRDIDIVVSTPQEGFGSKFGTAVPNLDVVHINNAYTGANGTSDGSYERPYQSVVDCETAGGDNGKCQQDSTPADTYGDYNVIRLWEGNSQTGGQEYTPITLLNGQMLAGEPITARNIVNFHQQGFWTGILDDINYGTEPVISGASPAVYLASDTSVLGVATISGGIQGTNVGGDIDIRYNNISAKYYDGTGVGINIDNTNISSNINIAYNSIVADGTGIRLRNFVDNGNYYSMTAGIYRNQIGAIAEYYSTTGIRLENEARYSGSTANQTTTIEDNFIIAASRYYSATGISADNSATKYGAATQSNSVLDNKYIAAVGGSSGTAIAADNYATKYGAATQTNTIAGNYYIVAADKYGINSATGVALSNSATWGTGFGSYGGGTATQYNTLSNNYYIGAMSKYGNATGVSVRNSAAAQYYSSTAIQTLSMDGNAIYARASIDGGSGTAIGIDVYNSATASNSGYAKASQTLTTIGCSNYVSANSYYAGSAIGINLFNNGNVGGSGGDVNAVQSMSMGSYNRVYANAYGTGNATGINASNNAYAYHAGIDTYYVNQSLTMGNRNTVSATSSSGDATGINLGNYAYAREAGIDAYYVNQSLTMGNYNYVSASSSSGNATGINASNSAVARYAGVVASQTLTMGHNNEISASTYYTGNVYYAPSAIGINLVNSADAYRAGADAYQSLTMGDGNVVSATTGMTGTGTAIGINLSNSADGYQAGTYAYQSLSMGSWNEVTAYSAYGLNTATGINASNSAYGVNAYADARQHLSMGDNNTVSADTRSNSNGTATGINLSNSAFAYYSDSAYALQTLSMGHYNDVSAYSGGGTTFGINAGNTAYGYQADADARQYLTMGDGNTVSAETDSWGSGSATGINLMNSADGYYAGINADQSLTVGDGNAVSATSSSGNATGIHASNSATLDSFSYGGTATATQNLTFNSGGYYYNNNSITATSTYGNATGIYASNLAQGGADNSTATATQTLVMDGVNVGAYGYSGATGVHLVNTANANNYADNSAATATQTATFSYYSSITANTYNGNAFGILAGNAASVGYDVAPPGGATSVATQTVTMSDGSISADSTNGNAYGVSASNTASHGGGYAGPATATQNLTLNDSSVSAYAYNTAIGIDATNYAAGNATGTQLVTLNQSSVSAFGDYNAAVFGIRADNEMNYGTATQTIALVGGSVYTHGSTGGAGIQVTNNGYNSSGNLTQTLTAAATDITAYGINQNGVVASTYGEYYGALVTQTVVVASGSIYAPNEDGVSLYSNGYTLQLGTVTGNYVYADTGVYMNNGLGGGQIVTVSGNTFNTTTQTNNVGTGTCVGGQCAP